MEMKLYNYRCLGNGLQSGKTADCLTFLQSKVYCYKSLRNEAGKPFPKQERQPVDLRGLFVFGVNMSEEWKPIEHYEDYAISNLGQVKRIVSKKGGGKRILKQKFNKNGYLRVGLWNANGQRFFFVHRLVATAFLGASGLSVNHKNGIKTDNRFENLEFIPLSENIQHAFKRV